MTQTAESVEQAVVTPLVCDRCGVQPQVIVRLRHGGVLVFCGHHANEHTDELVRQGGIMTTIRSLGG